ncbi:MAG: CRISPR-associated RAMP protein Csx7 [Thermoanaerobaculia bacterium]
MAEPATRFQTFDRLSVRHRITGRLVAETGLRVGADKSLDVGTSDQPVLRDAVGRVFLPGSSLKGVLRSGLEAVLRGLADERLRACDPLAAPCTEPLRKKAKAAGSPVDLDEVLETVCTVCGLFGCPYLAGRVFVADLPFEDATALRTEIRDGVGIDRDRRVARTRPAIKYDQEVVPRGASFRLEMILENVTDSVQLGLVLKALELLDTGEVRMGGLTSRGLGRVSLNDLRLERTDAARLLAGKGYDVLDLEEAKAGAESALAAVLWPEREEG